MSRNRQIRRLRSHSMDSTIRALSLDRVRGLCYLRASPVGSPYHFTLRQDSSMAQPEHPRFTASEPGLDFLQRRAVSSHRFSTVSLKESTLTSAPAGP